MCSWAPHALLTAGVLYGWQTGTGFHNAHKTSIFSGNGQQEKRHPAKTLTPELPDHLVPPAGQHCPEPRASCSLLAPQWLPPCPSGYSLQGKPVHVRTLRWP